MITINFKSLQIPVLASGKGWLVVDKPAGLTIHNDSGHDLCTITHAYMHKKPKLFKHICIDPEFGIHPAHRLDKETSGTLLLTADRETSRYFAKQFEHRLIEKHYIALLHGWIPPCPETAAGEKGPWETWQWPLSKNAGGRKNPAGSGVRIPAETQYRIIDVSAHYTLASIRLLTGRKHQIRRHAKLAGHPVAGDARYGSIRSVKFLKDTHDFDRIGLHAHSLSFQAPGRQDVQSIETSEIPAQLRMLFEKDKINV